MTIATAVASGGTKSGSILSGAVREVYSREILFQAQPSLVTAQFADTKTELGKEAGDTIKFTKYDDLVGSAKLTETENISTVGLSASQIAIQVDEYGYAVSESERLIRTSWDDTMGRATTLLGQHYGKTVDGAIQDEFRAAGSLQSIIVGGGANRSVLAAANTLDIKSIKDAVEILAVNKTMKINGAYVCLLHPHQARGMRDDDNWLEAHKYASPEQIFMGEIGMVEGVRFIDTTFITVVKKTTGKIFRDGRDTGTTEATYNASIDTYQALILGANCVGWAQALPVEMRDGGIIDFQRTRSLAWYSIFGAGQVKSENCCLLESA